MGKTAKKKTVELCKVRDQCFVPCRGSPGTQVARSELKAFCGFEQAGTVKGCPHRRRLSQVILLAKDKEVGCGTDQNEES